MTPVIPSIDDDIVIDAFDGENFTYDLFGGDWVADNYDMHEKFGVHAAVEALDNDKLKKFIEFRLKFLQEELDEAQAAYASLLSLETLSLASEAKETEVEKCGDEIVDAMIDLCVVAIGTLNAMGVDAYEAWERVHAANMAKEVGIKASRPNPLGLPDLVKPAGWVAPSHLDNLGLFRRFIDGHS
jgi:hypothetical protein